MPYPKNRAAAAARTSATEWMARKRASRIVNRSNTDPGPVIGSLRTCWCGRPAGHEWPGKATLHGMVVTAAPGTPHP
jgi:hypothetical protein